MKEVSNRAVYLVIAVILVLSLIGAFFVFTTMNSTGYSGDSYSPTDFQYAPVPVGQVTLLVVDVEGEDGQEST
jgi:hypothetical protein